MKNIKEQDVMINIAVCDDQIYHVKQLVKMIRKICVFKVPEQFDCRAYDGFYSAEDVIDFLKHNRINILFLDIEMTGMNGFELASVLNREFPEIIIIFVSAYENYVYSAFEYAPFRFLRKTHLEEELEPALLAAIDKLMSLHKTMIFDTVDGKLELRLADIIYFESDRNYFLIHHTGRDVYRCRGTVTEVAEQTKDDDFCRIHQAFVVNLANIKRTEGYSNVIMNNGDELPISARRMTEFKKAYMEYTNRRFSK